MRLYWEVAKRGFRRYSTYRAAIAAGVFTNCIFGFIKCYVLIALLRFKPHIGGYDMTDAVTFAWLTQAALMTVQVFAWYDIALRIRSGDVVTDLYRPLDFQAYWLAQDLGRAFLQLLFRGIPPFLVGALFFTLRVPVNPGVWVAFLASLTLAVLISFSMRFMLNLAAFWLLDYRGVMTLAIALWLLLAGLELPISFFPHWLERIARALPFAGMFQVPADIFLGKMAGPHIVSGLAFQAAWAVALLGAGRLMLAAATRRLVVQGG